MMYRQERATSRWSHIKRPLGEVWKENVWVTTSGMFDTAPLELLLKVSPRERVLFSVDYPFSACEMGKEFLGRIEGEGVLKGAELDGFVRGNAGKLLGLEGKDGKSSYKATK